MDYVVRVCWGILLLHAQIWGTEDSSLLLLYMYPLHQLMTSSHAGISPLSVVPVGGMIGSEIECTGDSRLRSDCAILHQSDF